VAVSNDPSRDEDESIRLFHADMARVAEAGGPTAWFVATVRTNLRAGAGFSLAMFAILSVIQRLPLIADGTPDPPIQYRSYLLAALLPCARFGSGG
jgi:hypothetical protein